MIQLWLYNAGDHDEEEAATNTSGSLCEVCLSVPVGPFTLHVGLQLLCS